jgi:hypothetical protein
LSDPPPPSPAAAAWTSAFTEYESVVVPGRTRSVDDRVVTRATVRNGFSSRRLRRCVWSANTLMPEFESSSKPGFSTLTTYVSGASERNAKPPDASVTAERESDGLVTVIFAPAIGAPVAALTTVPLRFPVVPAADGMPPARSANVTSTAAIQRKK